MKIRIRYRNNCIEEFDTARLTSSSPLSSDGILIDYEIRLDTIDRTGLWLYIHFYECSVTFEDIRSKEVPEAHRKKCCKCILESKTYLDEIESVHIDGRLAIVRIGDELVNVIKLDDNYAALVSENMDASVADKITALFEKLKHFPEYNGLTNQEISDLCGCTSPLRNELSNLKGSL
ncbi:MAG: hypothetical protein LUB61_07540 [Eggerthellaceae bacterium]|nr:hypothetical protein [Eggerthellaceae bacterium]